MIVTYCNYKNVCNDVLGDFRVIFKYDKIQIRLSFEKYYEKRWQKDVTKGPVFVLNQCHLDFQIIENIQQCSSRQFKFL